MSRVWLKLLLLREALGPAGQEAWRYAIARWLDLELAELYWLHGALRRGGADAMNVAWLMRARHLDLALLAPCHATHRLLLCVAYYALLQGVGLSDELLLGERLVCCVMRYGGHYTVEEAALLLWHAQPHDEPGPLQTAALMQALTRSARWDTQVGYFYGRTASFSVHLYDVLVLLLAHAPPQGERYLALQQGARQRRAAPTLDAHLKLWLVRYNRREVSAANAFVLAL